MSEVQTERSPLARIVIIIVCLSVAGAFAAGAHWYLIDLPEQKALSAQAPANPNTDLDEKCQSCTSVCIYLDESIKYQCLDNCCLICGDCKV